MATLKRREVPGMPRDLFDWAERPWTLLPFASDRIFRIEDYADDGRYVIRAELPGLDAAKDIDVTVDDDVLTISAERHEEHKETHRSEFRYGSLVRSVRLPGRPDAKDVTAHYDKGILEVSVPVPQATSGGQHIEVKQAG
jgi:HSP20 family molecular chaperone IbpA